MGKWSVLIGMMMVGLALRLAALDKQSLWLDEAYSLQVAESSVPQIVTGAVGDRHTPPLYYLLLHCWARLGRDELWLRLPSALLGVLAIPVIFVLGRALISERIGWIAGALLTVSPFHLYYSQEARMYTLLMLLVMGGAFCFWKGIGGAGVRWWVGYVVLSGLALYTHYYAGLVVLAQALYGLSAWRRHRDQVRPLALSLVAIGLAYLPWLPMLLGLAGTGGQSFREHMWSMIPYTFFRFNAGYALFVTNFQVKERIGSALVEHWPLMMAVFVTFAVLIVMGAREAMKRREVGIFLLLWLIVPPGVALLISTVFPILSERYLIVSFPAYVILLALGMEGIPRGGRVIAVIATCSLIAFGLIRYYTDPEFGKEQWREVARYISERAGEDDVIVVEPDYTQFAFDYYYKKSQRRIGVPAGDEERRLAGVMAENSRHRVWVVSRGGGAISPASRVLSTRFAKPVERTFPLEEGIVVRMYEASLPLQEAGESGRTAAGS